MNLAHQPFLNGRRWLHARRREREQRYSSTRFGEFRAHSAHEAGAIRSPASRRLPARRERTDRSLPPSWMSVHGKNSVSKFRPPNATASSPCRADRPCCARFRCASALRSTPAPARHAARGKILRSALHAPDQLPLRDGAFEIRRNHTVVSTSSSPALGLCWRSREIARLRAITASHPGSDPRDGSNCAASARAERKCPAKSLRPPACRAESGSGETRAMLHSGRTARQAPTRPAARFSNERRVRGPQVRSRLTDSPGSGDSILKIRTRKTFGLARAANSRRPASKLAKGCRKAERSLACREGASTRFSR